MLEFDRVADRYGSRVRIEDLVASVVDEGWANVVPVVTSIFPGAADYGLGMDKDATSCRSHGCGV
jgi:hypothetical protein